MFNVCPQCAEYCVEKTIKEHAATTQPPMTLYDTSHRSIAETARDVAQWIRQHLPGRSLVAA